MRELWKNFDDLSTQCYLNMGRGEAKPEVWNQGFLALLDALRAEKAERGSIACTLYQIDDDTEYSHDIAGWLEDYLDTLEIRGEHEKLIQDVQTLMYMFEWDKGDCADLRFRLAAAMGELGRIQERLSYCEDWYEQEDDNPIAGTALIYARLAAEDYEGAEQIVNCFISPDMPCDGMNDMVFIAASHLYNKMEKPEAAEWIDSALEKYDKELGAYFFGIDEDEFDDDLDWSKEELPF